jgi:hypothetical protein
MTPDAFRLRFPALEHTVWLDTPAVAPGADLVVDAVAEALEVWRSGERHRSAWWEETRQECRSLIAAYLGVPDSCVALMGSFAEAAATMAACLPPGRVVVGAGEYRSNLFPWLALDGGAHQVVCVHSQHGGVRTADLIAAITPGTVLVTISEVLSCDGVRADLPASRQAADELGARLRAAPGAARRDTSPTWLSWAGARPRSSSASRYRANESSSTACVSPPPSETAPERLARCRLAMGPATSSASVSPTPDRCWPGCNHGGSGQPPSATGCGLVFTTSTTTATLRRSCTCCESPCERHAARSRPAGLSTPTRIWPASTAYSRQRQSVGWST